MKIHYREFYKYDFLEMGNCLHKYFFDLFNVIYENHLVDTGMFKHLFVPNYVYKQYHRIHFYIRFSAENIQEEIDIISKYHKESSNKIVIVVLEDAEKLDIKSFYANKDILLISGEAIELLKEEISTERKFVPFFTGYCRRIFYQTNKKLLKKSDLKRILDDYKKRDKKCA